MLPASELPFDVASRDLYAVVGPDESMHVTIGTTWTAELSASAVAEGMRVEVFVPGSSLSIEGPLGRIVEVVGAVPVTAVRIEDLTAAMRPIPIDRPVVEPPTPGRPYLDAGFDVDLSQVTIRSPQREAMLRMLAQSIQTIDGRPYASLELEGSCSTDKAGPSCGVIAIGWASGSAGREDDWSIRATARTGLGGAIDGTFTTSIPRPLVRAAEWAARHDDRALAGIHAFENCCGATWDPSRPGMVTLTYERLCRNAFGPARDLADTGVCVDQLSITVDLRSGAVVTIEGPAGG